MNNQIGDSATSGKGEKPWPVIIMLTMLFSVIIVGLLLVPKTEEQKLMWLSILGTNNYGEFLNPPLELTGQLLDGDGNAWSSDMDVPWKLVLVNQGACEQSCQDMADLAARVHTRTNKLAPEIKRGSLSIGRNATIGQDALLDLGFQPLQTGDIDFPALLASSGVPPLSEGPLLFVMNPLEVFFLYYTKDHEGIGMLEDIEHVIKLAQ